MLQDYFPSDVQSGDAQPPLGKRIAAFYTRQFQLIKKIKRFLWISGLLFLITIVAGTVFSLLKPELNTKWMTRFSSEFIRRHPKQPTQWREFLSIFYNNLRVSLIMCLSGLVPFFFSSVGVLIANAGILSLIFSYLWINHKPAVKLFSTLILPHGIVELPTMVFVAGFSLYLSSQMTKRIFRKKRVLKTRTEDLFGCLNQESLPDRLDAFVDILYLFAGVILPLVLIATLLETFVTPFIYRIFA
jgi:stage II sporulation protein M